MRKQRQLLCAGSCSIIYVFNCVIITDFWSSDGLPHWLRQWPRVKYFVWLWPWL